MIAKTRAGKILNQLPPEGVPIPFRISSRWARVGAQLLDLVLTWSAAILLLLGCVWLRLLTWQALDALLSLTFFFIRIPYYILAELVWNGRTLGKRLLRIRVVSRDGRRLTPHQIVARNLMKEAEVFLPISTLFNATMVADWFQWVLVAWVAGVLAVPFLNRGAQRLGDLLAGTVVVDTPRPRLMPDLAAGVVVDTLTFSTAELDIYGRHELQVLEGLLRDKPKSRASISNLDEVTKAICRRIGRSQSPKGLDAQWEFLLAFYRQQREYLESRSLFGDRREDRNHRKP